MAYLATTLEEAISQTNSRVASGNTVGLLKFYIDSFTAQWSPLFDKKNVAQRTVRNWAVQSSIVSAATPLEGNPQQAQDVVDVACRVMYATIAAHDASPQRITTAQRDSVLAAWNNSFEIAP